MTSAAEAGPRPDADTSGGRGSSPAPKRFRESLAAEYLLAAVRAMHPHAEPRAFVAEWWDGSALVPALLVEIEGRPVRAVSGPAGELVLLPHRSWPARRRLRRARRPVAAEAAPPVPERPHVALTPGGLPRTPLIREVPGKRPRVRDGRPGPKPPLRVAPAVDYRACSYVGCGAIVPLPAAGDDPPCPRCGRR